MPRRGRRASPRWTPSIVTGFAASAADLPASVEATRIADVDVFVITPEGADAGDDAPDALDIHGGALIAGGGEACRLMAISAARRAGLHTWAVDYRMPPDHPYPTPLDDCVAVYRALLEIKPAAKIVVDGGSAGGNLAAAMMLRARAEGLPMPAALMLFTPEVDLTESGDTFDTNEGIDYVLREPSDRVDRAVRERPRPHRPVPVADVRRRQRVPADVPAGRARATCSSPTRCACTATLRAAGVEAELHVWEGMPHGGFFGAPEDAEIALEARTFLGKHRTPAGQRDPAHTARRSQSTSRSGATLWLWPVPGSTNRVKSSQPVKQAGIVCGSPAMSCSPSARNTGTSTAAISSSTLPGIIDVSPTTPSNRLFTEPSAVERLRRHVHAAEQER